MTPVHVVSLVGTVAIVLGVAVPPTSAAVVATARDDAYTVLVDHTLTVGPPGVLDNDTFVIGAGAADLRADVGHGTLTLDEDGGFRYQPDEGFVGTDTFRYRIPGGLLLLLPSNTATVTITVTPPPTPTLSPTPSPTPRPLSPPLPSVLPLPTLPPIPTLPPTPTPSLSPRPTLTPPPSSNPRPTVPPTPSEPSRPSPPPSAGVGAGGGPIGPTGGDGTPPSTAAPVSGPFDAAAPGGEAGIDLDLGPVTLVGFEWAVPALVLAVPGLLIVIVTAQAAIGLAWLPVARRWLGADHRRRRPRPNLSGG